LLATTERSVPGDAAPGNATFTADYCVVTKGATASGAEVAKTPELLLIQAVKSHGDGQIYLCQVTERWNGEHGIVKSFGTGDPGNPAYTIVSKLYLKASSAYETVRKVQKASAATARDQVERSLSMVRL